MLTLVALPRPPQNSMRQTARSPPSCAARRAYARGSRLYTGSLAVPGRHAAKISLIFQQTGCLRVLGQQPAGGSNYVADDESIVAGMAGRYATALFDLAKEQGALDAVAGDLSAVTTMLSQSPDLARLVRSPVFSAEDQARAMSAVLDKAGVSGLTQNFIKLIARNRRLFSLGDMIRDFQTLFARMKG